MSNTVLGCARAARTVAFSRHVTRALTTEASTSTSPAGDVPPPTRSQNDLKRRPIGNYRMAKSDKTVYIRSWDDIGSMPEFFALLRGVEKRFGRVQEFRLPRDYDVPTAYLNYFMVRFAEDEAYERVPGNGTNIRVEVPVIKADRSGGVGLDDLRDLHRSQDRDPDLDTSGLYGPTISVTPTAEASESSTTKVIELVVQRAKHDELFEPRPRVRLNPAFGVAFHNWGGFYTPTSDEQPVSPQMAQVLDKWSKAARDAARKKSPDHDENVAQRLDSLEQQAAQAQEHKEAAQDDEDASSSSSSPSTEAESRAAHYKIDASLFDVSVETAHDEPVPAPAPELTPSSPSALATSTDPSTLRLTRKQKILALARENARAPLPDAKRAAAEQEAQKKAGEKNRTSADVGSMRERLLKLMGGKWL
ncbi:hypothetical protein C8Q74DRAFT_1364114 [Fomes fomentarius]|nr:hypothetical protein C8Q74DRAFT_1364114 [Fomes fomentarius]